MQNGQIVVVAPLSGSPAEKAKIKPKDIIIEIDGADTVDMTLNQAVDKIRGVAGTQIKLKIVRQGSDGPLEFSVTRENIKVESATYNVENYSGKKIAILKVSQFGDDTVFLAEKFANQARSDSVSGIVLDLRNNPGGYLDSSVQFSGIFLEKGKVVTIEVDKKGAKKEYKTDNDPIIKNLPLVVLVNDGSASAAEIVAGAMRDYGRAETIGVKTFGKGSVQALEPLPGGAALKITIAKWLTPNGTEINSKGIVPGIEIKLSDDDRNKNLDPQMDKAKERVFYKINHP